MRIKGFISIACVTLCGVAASVSHAACDDPAPPEKLPDSSAPFSEFKSTMPAVLKYNVAVNDQMTCINDAHQAELASRPDATSQQRAEMERIKQLRLKAVVDHMDSVIEPFRKAMMVSERRFLAERQAREDAERRARMLATQKKEKLAAEEKANKLH